MLTGLHLPVQFDPALLRADLARVLPDEWVPHYNQLDYGGEWRGAALRSPSGAVRELEANGQAYSGTPLLDRCPYFREVLAVFACPLKSVRLLALAPGSFIREHTDNALDYADGEVRLHIPIQTNPDIEFYVCGERLLLEEGHAYYVNVNLPHRVNNRGTSDRIHLVIDARVDDWVHELFRRGEPIERSSRPPRGIEEFRRHLFSDPGWQEPLRSLADPREFEREAVRLAGHAGLAVHEGDIGAVLHGQPAEAPAGWKPPRGWTPTRFLVRDGTPWAEWIQTGDRRFLEPFFEDTVRRCLYMPLARFSRCEAPLPADEPDLRPCGFIFHMSRCGSTLAAQMFAALDRVSVVAEAPPVDEAVQAGNAEWLRRIVFALGRHRTGAERHYILKLDAWHVHALPLIREAFPDTPWVFLYRDPADVLRSQLRNPGRHCIPPSPAPLDQSCAQVIATICRSALACTGDPRSLFVDYRDLPDAVPARIAPHFGIPLSNDEIAQMRIAARVDAKNPGMPFKPRPQDPNPPIEELVRKFGLAEIYRRLRQITPHGGAA